MTLPAIIPLHAWWKMHFTHEYWLIKWSWLVVCVVHISSLACPTEHVPAVWLRIIVHLHYEWVISCKHHIYVQVCGGCQGNSCGYGILQKEKSDASFYILCSQYWYVQHCCMTQWVWELSQQWCHVHGQWSKTITALHCTLVFDHHCITWHI